MEKPTKEQKALIRSVDAVFKAVDGVIPSDWTKNQVAAVLQAYLELYR